MSLRPRSLTVGLVLACVLTASPTAAGASSYSEAPPSFDGLTMLRVAQGYNLTKAYDLSFPATSEEACEIAGVSAQTFVVKDHQAWARTPEGFELMQASLDEARAASPEDSHYVPCYWLRFGSASNFFSGLRRVWPATLQLNFKHLRRAMRRADCGEVTKRLGKYPPVNLAANRIRNKVKAAAGGDCRRADDARRTGPLP